MTPRSATLTSVPELLPRWDVTDVFPSLTSREFSDATESFGASVARLGALYDLHHVGADNTDPGGVDEVLDATNAVRDESQRIGVYVLSVTSTNSFDANGQRAQSELRDIDASVGQLVARFTAWVGACGAAAMIGSGPVAAEHAWPLRRFELRATHQMSPDQEDLYAEISTTGSQAWGQLFNDVTSQLEADVEGRGRLPMAAVRGLATNADPDVRRHAYQAELATWPTVTTVLAHAMNAIKGEANIVNKRRSWASPLDASLYGNAVDRTTYDAMMSAAHTALPDFRSFLRTKATLHGYSGGLRWYDLFAPLPTSSGAVSWTDGCERVNDAFGAFSPALAALSRQAVADRWIDAEPRAGKRGGAFCAPLEDGRSIVHLNWSGSADSVSTLAHELGHAYHNTQLAQRTALQRAAPMALAETASIFCETLLVEDGLTRAEGAERLSLLDVDLQGSTQVVVDIMSRVSFETEVFARRQKRTLTADELCELMTTAQIDAYGDGLSPDTLHPYMWALKPHYYSAHFYNWPYMFGLLFGLGLHAVSVADPDRFRSGYDDLLSRVGMASAAELGAPFGIDVNDEAFWTASFDTVRARIAEYQRLAGTLA
jgi:oligoendopeptidase F